MVSPEKFRKDTMFRTRIRAKLCLWVWCGLLPASGTHAQDKAKAPSETNSSEQVFQSAETFQVAGDYEKAAAAYREAVSVALQQLGNLRVSHKEFTEGIDLLARAVQAAPARVTARVDLTIAQFEVRDFDKAKTEIEAALQREPGNARALNLAGKIYFMKGDFAAAANRLESALRLQPDFDTGYLLALADLELKNPVPAGVIFDEMQASSQPSASMHVLIGLAYRETGYLDQAAIHFAKAIELEPKKSRVRSSLGLTYFLQGPQSYAKAREQFMAELSITPDDSNSRYYLGTIAAREGKANEAEKWFEQVASGLPDDPEAYFRLGQASLNAGHMEKAVAALQKSLALAPHAGDDPDAPEAHELMSKAQEKLGRHAEAESELARAKLLRSQQAERGSRQIPDAFSGAGSGEAASISRSGQQQLRSMLLRRPQASELPGSQEAEFVKRISALLGEAYHNLGVIDARASRYANAEEEFAEAARWNPGIERLDRNWGLAAFRAERYEHAIGPIERLLRQSPKDNNLRQMLGLSYYMTDQFAKSAETFRPILNELPDNPGLLYAAGVALVRSGDSAAGGRLFSRMLEHGANSPEVHLMVGQAHYGQSQYPEALLEFQRALDLNSNLAEAHYFIGMVYFKQGKLDQSVEELNAELSENPRSVPAMYQLAYVRLEQHQTEEAIRLLNAALAEKPSYGDAHYQLGKALLDKGNASGAIQHLETATQLQPAQYYGYYQLSLAYRRIGRVEDADKALRTYQQLKEKNSRRNSGEGPSN
jgi:tetratricopeptide (TPR) repeat protein